MAKVDAEKQRGIAEVLGITAYPSVFGLKDGVILDNFVGGLPQEEVLVVWAIQLGTVAKQSNFHYFKVFHFKQWAVFYRKQRPFISYRTQPMVGFH